MTSGCRFRFIKSVTVKAGLKKKKSPNNKQMRDSLKGFSNCHLSQGKSQEHDAKPKTYQINTLSKTSLHFKDETPELATFLRYFNKKYNISVEISWVWELISALCLDIEEGMAEIQGDLMIWSSFPTQNPSFSKAQ